MTTRLGLVLCMSLAGLAADAAEPRKLTVVAESSNQWTGVAVSPGGRTFVTFPRWSTNTTPSVGEVLKDGTVRPFPDAAWNTSDASVPAGERWVCAQGVYADEFNRLWILDSAAPFFQGPVAGGPKLVLVDLANDDQVSEVIPFDAKVAPPGSYFNDVRVDTRRDVAYITDSGLGALVVVNIPRRTARRVLVDHPSTKSEGVDLRIEGSVFRMPDGSRPRVHADGLALSQDRQYLYFQALTGRTMYRIQTVVLLDSAYDDEQFARDVERVGVSGAADGLATGPDGRIYLAAIEDNAIRVLGANGFSDVVVRDPRLSWPASIAFSPDGSLYVTSAQIHRPPDARDPYRIFRLPPESRAGVGAEPTPQAR